MSDQKQEYAPSPPDGTPQEGLADGLMRRVQGVVGDAYELRREIGGGGMSRLFLAHDASLHRDVVVKVLAPELMSQVLAARFKQEFEVTALLQHPHILPILAAGAKDGLLYYVMPYVAGESLRHRLTREKQLPLADVSRILYEMSDALAYAHERGVVHRDIKPENILLQGSHAVLADFGIAKALGASAALEQGGGRLTEMGMSMGTPGYMSPEQAAGEDPDARADIYALAVVGYEMLSGAPPFSGPTPRAVIAAHLSEEPPRPVASLRADTPPGLAAAIMHGLEKDPAARFQTAAELRDALAAGSITSGAWAHATGPGAAGATAPRRRRWPMVAAGAALLLAAAAGGAAYYATARGRAADNANLVAVAPFEVLDPALAMWKEGIVDALSANLDGAGPIRTVAPTVVIRRWDGRPDAASAGELATATGARLVVFGRMSKAGPDSVRLTASLYDAGAGRALGGGFDLREDASRVERAVDRLTIMVLNELNQTRNLASVRRAPIGSSSPSAIKAYLQGEQHYRKSDWDSAAFYYARAIAEDSTFAPALRKLSNVHGWQLGMSGESSVQAYQYSLRAGALNRGLAPRESVLVAVDSMWAALGVRSLDQAGMPTVAGRLFALLREATRRFPDDPEMWYKLGDARFHFFAVSPGDSHATAREAFDRAIALDSAFAPAYIHPVGIALEQQDEAGARRYIRAYLALQATDRHADAMRVLERLLDPAQREALLAGGEIFQQVSPPALSDAISNLLTYSDTAETMLRIARAVSASAGSPKIPPGARRQVAQLYPTVLLYHGRAREARAALGDTSLTWSLLPAVAAFGGIPEDTARMIFRGWGMNRVDPLIAWWVVRGDTAAMRPLVRWADTTTARGLPPNVKDRLRFFLAVARRDTAGVLRMATTMPDSACAGCALNRLLKAQYLAAAGRDREASLVLAGEYPGASPERVLWMMERGRVAERLGEKEKAIDAYAFVAAAWAKADPMLQPIVEEARGGLRRLGGKG
ncbi:MAG TPA: protein kinase [Gemmatimonadaceae bacterium]|nr:protein kinase [Gemmatimonadaceae bacterium]